MFIDEGCTVVISSHSSIPKHFVPYVAKVAEVA